MKFWKKLKNIDDRICEKSGKLNKMMLKIGWKDFNENRIMMLGWFYHMSTLSGYFMLRSVKQLWSPSGVAVNMLDCNIVVCEFKL